MLLFQWKEFNPRQVLYVLETVIGGHKHMIGKARCQFERKGIRIRDLSVHFELGSADCSFRADWDNLQLTWKKTAFVVYVLARTETFAQISGNLAPLNG